MPTLPKPSKKYSYESRKHGNTKIIQSIYNTTIWKNLRSAYLQQHPLCEVCLQDDKINPAVEVHHIKPISSGKDEWQMRDIAYDSNNLLALCQDCHHKIHNNERKIKRKKSNNDY